MNPSNHAKSHFDYFKDLIKGDDASTEAHRKFYDEYNAVLDMDADYYLETIKVVFQEFSLVSGTWDVKGVDGKIERVRPADITTTALFSVEGELDDISGSGQTEAVHSICQGVIASEQKHLEVPGAGHYGIFAGRRWREVVYPEVKSFILKHQPKSKPVAVVATPSVPPVPVASPAAPVAVAPAAVAAPAAVVAAAQPQKKVVSPAPAVVAKKTPTIEIKTTMAPLPKVQAPVAPTVAAAAKGPRKK
jgi:poly(3-hydroxybutyrate) depolymerase